MTRLAGIGAVLLGLASVGCSKNYTDQAAAKILEQSSEDLKCDKSKIKVNKISDGESYRGVKNYSFGVAGCEKQARYTATCSGWAGCSAIIDVNDKPTSTE